MELKNISKNFIGLEAEVIGDIMNQLKGANIPINARGLDMDNTLGIEMSNGEITLNTIKGTIIYDFESLPKEKEYQFKFVTGENYPSPFIQINPNKDLIEKGAKSIIIYGNNRGSDKQ